MKGLTLFAGAPASSEARIGIRLVAGLRRMGLLEPAWARRRPPRRLRNWAQDALPAHVVFEPITEDDLAEFARVDKIIERRASAHVRRWSQCIYCRQGLGKKAPAGLDDYHMVEVEIGGWEYRRCQDPDPLG